MHNSIFLQPGEVSTVKTGCICFLHLHIFLNSRKNMTTKLTI